MGVPAGCASQETIGFDPCVFHTHTHTHTHTHFQVQGLEKGVSENEAPGPVGAYTTTHNNTPTQMPDHGSKLRTATFNQESSFCREESGL